MVGDRDAVVIWHELRRLAHIVAELAARLVDLEHRVDHLDPPDPEVHPDGPRHP